MGALSTMGGAGSKEAAQKAGAGVEAEAEAAPEVRAEAGAEAAAAAEEAAEQAVENQAAAEARTAKGQEKAKEAWDAAQAVAMASTEAQMPGAGGPPEPAAASGAPAADEKQAGPIRRASRSMFTLCVAQWSALCPRGPTISNCEVTISNCEVGRHGWLLKPPPSDTHPSDVRPPYTRTGGVA